MKKTTIKAVEMVRRIRDAHYEQLRGKSPEERIAFYRAKVARVCRLRSPRNAKNTPTNETPACLMDVRSTRKRFVPFGGLSWQRSGPHGSPSWAASLFGGRAPDTASS